jgi:hypothetical protein
MTAAYRMKGVGWFGGCVAVVLGFYLVSLQVAAERKKLEAVNGQIRSAHRDIRALETEFDTRGNLAQLERWNGDTLALSAPTAGQFVASEAALASLDVNSLGGGGIQTVALLVPSGAGPAVQLAAAQIPAAQIPAVQISVASVQTASIKAARAAPVRMAQVTAPRAMNVAIQVASRTALKPVVIRASVAPSRAAEAAIVRSARTERLAAVAKVRPQAVAMLDRKLLSDTTLGDIMSGARSESGRRR